ncbi:MAG: 2-oxoglutarate dehydrogenase complex dihydrolipoyllysine-residue succinyltransferase [Anaerolineae bacterium]|nr:2-oxoglutarate dehydrogenase complex dihydrolipoyllysine-residue succinyltransferase [Anaerolineae bacterium]
MSVEIVVPDLGESVVEVTVAEWLKKEGDYVNVGEAVVVIESEKANLEVGAEKSGVLARIVRREGEDAAVGEVLGLIEAAAQPAETPPEMTPKPAAAAEPEPAPAGDGADRTAGPDRERVTPVARRVAQSHAVDLAEVMPSGAGGRVTKDDVERYIAGRREAARPEAPAPAHEPAAALPDAGRREERVRMSRRRRTIAERLVEAQRTAAMLTTFNDVDMGAVMDLRARRKEAFKEKHGVSLGISSFFVKAVVGALRAFPQLNAEIDGDEVVIKHYYDIGVAIGASGGLVVPVLRDADRMSFAEIEKRIKDYAQQAEANTLALEDLRGGTFTITNGGVFGSLLSTPILNPPQVGILGLHRIEDRAVARDGAVVIRPMMFLALSYDHRLVDGREAVQFLARVKALVEDPEALLLEG